MADKSAVEAAREYIEFQSLVNSEFTVSLFISRFSRSSEQRLFLKHAAACIPKCQKRSWFCWCTRHAYSRITSCCDVQSAAFRW